MQIKNDWWSQIIWVIIQLVTHSKYELKWVLRLVIKIYFIRSRTRAFIKVDQISEFIAPVTWLEYCQYGIKHKTINQSIYNNQSKFIHMKCVSETKHTFVINLVTWVVVTVTWHGVSGVSGVTSGRRKRSFFSSLSSNRMRFFVSRVHITMFSTSVSWSSRIRSTTHNAKHESKYLSYKQCEKNIITRIVNELIKKLVINK